MKMPEPPSDESQGPQTSHNLPAALTTELPGESQQTLAVGACHPSYAFADGDLFLRSSDGIRFHIHSLFLKFASKYFQRMLEEISSRNPPSVTTTLDLQEDSRVLKALLDLVYPNSNRLVSFPSFELFQSVALTARKYEMDSVLENIRAFAGAATAVQNDAVGVYCLARRKYLTKLYPTSQTCFVI